MMLLKKYILYISLVIIFCSTAFSQGGSNYSVFGIGDILSSYSASFDGLAGTSTAIPSENNINMKNPALWGTVTTTRLQAGYRFNQHINQYDQQKLYQNNGKVNDILGIFSIDTSLGISVAFGIVPYSNVNYLIRTPVNIKVDDDFALAGYTEFQGSGGITDGFVGGSVKLFSGLSIGASIFSSFGYFNTSTQSTFSNASNAYPAKIQKSDNVSGYGFKGGLYYTTPSGFNFGIFVEDRQNYTIYSHNLYHVTQYTSDAYSAPYLKDTTLSDTFNLKIPLTWGLGASYKTDKFIFGADFSMQDFTNFTYGKGPSNNFRNSYQFSLGVSRFGNPSLSGSTLDRSRYNLGFCYKQLYYTVAGTSINEYYGAFGMGIPLVGSSLIDASVNIGKRGTLDNKLINEYFGRLMIDISIGEVWFHPFKREN